MLNIFGWVANFDDIIGNFPIPRRKIFPFLQFKPFKPLKIWLFLQVTVLLWELENYRKAFRVNFNLKSFLKTFCRFGKVTCPQEKWTFISPFEGRFFVRFFNFFLHGCKAFITFLCFIFWRLNFSRSHGTGRTAKLGDFRDFSI